MTDRPYYDRAKTALEAAHKACYDHPNRGPIGMSHGPFSGVNEALGIVATLEEALGKAQAEMLSMLAGSDVYAKALRAKFKNGRYAEKWAAQDAEWVEAEKLIAAEALEAAAQKHDEANESHKAEACRRVARFIATIQPTIED